MQRAVCKAARCTATTHRSFKVRTLSFGIVGERAIFVDERTDSYFTLDPGGEKHLHRLMEQAEPLSTDVDLLDSLGVADEPAEVIRARHPSPSNSLFDQYSPGRPTLADIFRAGSLVRSTRSRVRRRPIEAVLDELIDRDCASSAGPSRREELIVRAMRFLSARRFVPLERNCLVDSLSLLRWLGTYRNAAALVFGAKLNPFAAHCWVQAGDLVVNDRVETVAAFTAVRVIRCSEATP